MIDVAARRRGVRSRTTRRPRCCSAFILAALVLTLGVHDAAAGKGWCRTDPVVLLNGNAVDIRIGSTPAALTAVTGPTRLVVTVPVGTDAAFVISDLGFGRGYDERIVESPDLSATADGIAVQVAVYLPAADGTLPVTVEFAPGLLSLLAPVSVDGTANEWITVATAV